MKQLTYSEFKENQKKFQPNIVLILENLDHNENIGSAFRLADAINVKKIYIVTDRELNFRKIEKTAWNCSTSVPYEIMPSIDDVVIIVKSQNYTPVSVEICDDSVPLRECDFSKYYGIALIVGNENMVFLKALWIVQNFALI